jgi:hypothetical protein
MAKKEPRNPNDPSNWVVTESSMHSARGVERTGMETPHSTYRTVSASLVAPETDEEAIPETGMARGARPINLDVSFNFQDKGPAMFTRPNEGPDQTPEQWERIRYNGTPTGLNGPPMPSETSQGLLFQRPERTAAKIEWMRSTKADRTRIGTGLGILQNEADRRRLGDLSEGDKPDLSKHSSRLVEHITGREHKVTNQFGFYGEEEEMDHDPYSGEGDPERSLMDMPRQGEGGEFTSGRPELGYETHTRILPKGEANMGVSRFRAHLAASPEGKQRAERKAARRRASEPTYTQGELF